MLKRQSEYLRALILVKKSDVFDGRLLTYRYFLPLFYESTEQFSFILIV